jgi:flagellar hook assembly protein FlgD
MAYQVSTPGDVVDIKVFDLAGRLVRTLANGPQAPGYHFVMWDGRDDQGAGIRKGIYFVRARVGTQVKHVQVTMVR